jgi:hypothetical protein
MHKSILRRIAFLYLPALWLLAGPPVHAQTGAPINDLDAYAVYASLLPISFGTDDTDRSRIALLQETRSKLTCPREEMFSAEWRTVWESYKRENTRVRSLLPNVDLGLPYVLVTLAQVRNLLMQAGNDGKTIRGGWSEAYTSFPNGRLLAVSAVGFDESKARAIVTVQYNCGLSRDPRSLEYDCHGGEQIALRKENGGRWMRATEVPTCGWIA